MDATRRYPKLRWPLDIQMIDSDDGQALLMRCPQGISPQPLAIHPACGRILSVMDGNTSSEDIISKFSGDGLTDELFAQLLTLLDDNLMLSNSRFFAAEAEVKESFKSASVRPAALVGLSYPLKSADLTQLVDGYLSNGDLKAQENFIGLMAPHIDYRRGGISYGLTYNLLKEQPLDICILIGTSHQFSRRLFHLTAKDFDSPLGKVLCEATFVELLAKKYGSERAFADEMLHRKEHSLELQIPFMKRLSAEVKIIPILVGSFHRMLGSGKLPNAWDEYESFVGALAECVNKYRSDGRRISFIAGVDMAHVGRNFGDLGQLTPEFMQQIEARDREYLEMISSQNKEGLFHHIESDSDARRICGFPTMYTLLDLCQRVGWNFKTRLIDYRQAVDYRTDCAVTFAGMEFSLN